MAEAVGAAATLISIIGFSAQVFDGCVKGFVLLSTANNLGTPLFNSHYNGRYIVEPRRRYPFL